MHFREKSIVWKITENFREELIIAPKCTKNYLAPQIIIQKFAWTRTIDITKMRANFLKMLFHVKFLWKVKKKNKNFIEICLDYFCTILHVFGCWPKRCLHLNLVPRVSHLTAWGKRGETLVGSGHVSPRIWEMTIKLMKGWVAKKEFCIYLAYGMRDVLSPK